VTRDFVLHDAVLLATQAALVGMVAAGVTDWARRFATARWALVLPLSIGVVVAAIALVPQVADGLTWLALVAIPPLAALALGWAMRGARPPYALGAVALLALALADPSGLAGDAAAAHRASGLPVSVSNVPRPVDVLFGPTTPRIPSSSLSRGPGGGAPGACPTGPAAQT
jgi:hypothetical protein